MMTHFKIVRRAPLALTATAALLSTAALAQTATTADPVIVLPDMQTTAPAPSVPTTTAPTTAAPVVTSATTATTATTSAPTAAPRIVLPEPVEADATPAEAPATRTAAPVERAAATSSPKAAPAPAEPVSRTATAETTASNDASTTPVVGPEPISATDALGNEMMASSEPSAAVAPVEQAAPADNSTNELVIAGALGALGLAAVGGIAILASRRRRGAELAPQRVAVERTVTPDPTPEVSSVAAPAPTVAPRQSAPAMTYASRAPASANGDPVILPAELPQTYEERDDLLRRLIAAKPDRANPFKSPAARARRARLIMQSLGRRFENRKPRFDLSQYTNRWPALRGWQPATA